MRHLLTSLAQRALLQPEVRDSPERRKRRAAAAGRIISPGLILTAHQHGTGNTYINRTHRAGPQRTNKQNFIADIPTEGEKSCSWCIHRESEIKGEILNMWNSGEGSSYWVCLAKFRSCLQKRFSCCPDGLEQLFHLTPMMHTVFSSCVTYICVLHTVHDMRPNKWVL